MLLGPALYVWVWPTWQQLGWLVLLGTLGGIGQMGMAEALRLGPTHVIIPVDFTRLLFVSLLAYLAFGEVPDAFVWLGGLMIFCSTAFITYREHMKRQLVKTGTEEFPKPPVNE